MTLETFKKADRLILRIDKLKKALIHASSFTLLKFPHNDIEVNAGDIPFENGSLADFIAKAISQEVSRLEAVLNSL